MSPGPIGLAVRHKSDRRGNLFLLTHELSAALSKTATDEVFLALRQAKRGSAEHQSPPGQEGHLRVGYFSGQVIVGELRVLYQRIHTVLAMVIVPAVDNVFVGMSFLDQLSSVLVTCCKSPEVSAEKLLPKYTDVHNQLEGLVTCRGPRHLSGSTNGTVNSLGAAMLPPAEDERAVLEALSVSFALPEECRPRRQSESAAEPPRPVESLPPSLSPYPMHTSALRVGAPAIFRPGSARRQPASESDVDSSGRFASESTAAAESASEACAPFPAFGADAPGAVGSTPFEPFGAAAAQPAEAEAPFNPFGAEVAQPAEAVAPFEPFGAAAAQPAEAEAPFNPFGAEVAQPTEAVAPFEPFGAELAQPAEAAAPFELFVDGPAEVQTTPTASLSPAADLAPLQMSGVTELNSSTAAETQDAAVARSNSRLLGLLSVADSVLEDDPFAEDDPFEGSAEPSETSTPTLPLESLPPSSPIYDTRGPETALHDSCDSAPTVAPPAAPTTPQAPPGPSLAATPDPFAFTPTAAAEPQPAVPNDFEAHAKVPIVAEWDSFLEPPVMPPAITSLADPFMSPQPDLPPVQVAPPVKPSLRRREEATWHIHGGAVCTVQSIQGAVKATLPASSKPSQASGVRFSLLRLLQHPRWEVLLSRRQSARKDDAQGDVGVDVTVLASLMTPDDDGAYGLVRYQVQPQRGDVPCPLRLRALAVRLPSGSWSLSLPYDVNAAWPLWDSLHDVEIEVLIGAGAEPLQASPRAEWDKSSGLLRWRMPALGAQSTRGALRATIRRGSTPDDAACDSIWVTWRNRAPPTCLRT
ncbi:hypothetical protein CYMTET_29703 [Cymbomonas tetramitiformis]|uniref:MHD domain-containing protein n=1 Tax=Cymbomonas tetramitiformis TaxID=36881 RepID=A0AAE0FKH9_9CHLO|nr:hypothetical protein CYMTET_29703 [Cymbomonas tetramitiformis]